MSKQEMELENIELNGQEIADATARAKDAAQNEPRIAHAQFLPETGWLRLELAGGAAPGAILTVPARSVVGLGEATDSQLSDFLVAGGGASIRWPQLGVGFATAPLVRALCGLKSPTLSAHLSRIGKARTSAKSASSRENGKKGGRPRKTPVAA